jgi:hypothetical protein
LKSISSAFYDLRVQGYGVFLEMARVLGVFWGGGGYFFIFDWITGRKRGISPEQCLRQRTTAPRMCRNLRQLLFFVFTKKRTSIAWVAGNGRAKKKSAGAVVFFLHIIFS